MYAIYNAFFCVPMARFDQKRRLFEECLGPYVDRWVPDWVTPNRLGGFRIALAAPICYLLFWVQFLYFGLFLYIIACSTDFLDGLIARRRRKVTKLGKMLDPVADKILHCPLFIFSLYFFALDFLLRSSIIIIVAADLATLILGVGILFFIRGIRIESNIVGKIKFGSQCFGFVCLILGWTGLTVYALPTAAAMGTLSTISYLFAIIYR